jgi:hypothetical protein
MAANPKIYEMVGFSSEAAMDMALQDSVREDDAKQRVEGVDYSSQHVRQSLVHSREDIVLI